MAEQHGAGIIGIGSFLPPQIRSNDFWPSNFKPRDETERRSDILAIERATDGQTTALAPEIVEAMAVIGDDPFRGSRKRHVLDAEAETSDMEAEACRRAIRDAGLDPRDIDLLIVNSVLPDRIQPSNAPALQAKCELAHATAWAMDAACASFQPMVVTAAALVRTGAYRNVLCVWSYAASRFMDYSKPLSTGLGDGAGAVVIGRAPAGYGVIGHYMRTDGTMRDGVVIAPVIQGEIQRRWDRCSGPVEITSMNVEIGKSAGLSVTKACRESCEGALAAAGLSLANLSFYVGNQSLGWMVDACRRALGLPWEKTIDTFAEIANLGAATIPINLERVARRGQVKDGDVVAMFSQGAGFTVAAIAYRWFRRDP